MDGPFRRFGKAEGFKQRILEPIKGVVFIWAVTKLTPGYLLWGIILPSYIRIIRSRWSNQYNGNVINRLNVAHVTDFALILAQKIQSIIGISGIFSNSKPSQYFCTSKWSRHISVVTTKAIMKSSIFHLFFSENKHAHSTHWWHFHRKNPWPTTRHTDEHPPSHSIFFTLWKQLSDWRPIGPNEKLSWKHQVQRGSVGENRSRESDGFYVVNKWEVWCFRILVSYCWWLKS